MGTAGLPTIRHSSDSGTGWGPATLKTPRSPASSARQTASAASDSCIRWNSGSKPSTVGTRLPDRKLASVLRRPWPRV